MQQPLLLHFQNLVPYEAGVDEAGRGCLAGPVFAAAVILPPDLPQVMQAHLNDSKKLSFARRVMLKQEIINCALAWGVASADTTEIDRINILQASFLAMHRAIAQLNPVPGLLLIDGNRFKPYPGIGHHCIIKGDGRFYSIAAASVLAKTFRDEFMATAHQNHPQYNWVQNKGYPTPAHKQAIAMHGLSPLHRKSFNSGLQLKFKL